MKKNLFIAAALAVLTVSCNKKEEVKHTETHVETTEPAQTPAAATTDSAKIKETPKADYKVISTSTFKSDKLEVKVDFLNDQKDKFFVRFSHDGKEYILPQTQAWSKGGIYTDGKTEFEFKGQVDAATLKIDGKTYELKEVK